MAPKTAAPKSGAFERVRMEPLPEHLYEEITAEQLVIDIAALTDLTEDEVRQTGVQNNLVALHLAGNVPEHRQDLQRLAQGETMIRPSGPPVENATGPAAIDAALGINVSTGNVDLQMQKQECLHRQMQEWSLEPMGHLPLHQHWECCLGLSHRLLRMQLRRMNRYLPLPHRVGRMRL